MRYAQFCENHRNWLYLTHFPTNFYVIGHVLTDKCIQIQVQAHIKISADYPCHFLDKMIILTDI